MPSQLLDALDALAQAGYLVEQLVCELTEQRDCRADDPIRRAGRGTSCAGVRRGKLSRLACLRWAMGQNVP